VPRTKSLSVRLHGRPVGELVEDAGGRLSFTYNARYCSTSTLPLSLALPVTDRPFGHEASQAFFGGFLPDDPVARQALGRLFHASPTNDFSLLAAIGRDCAGAVSLIDPDAPVVPDEDRQGTYEPLDEAALAGLLRTLPSRPLFSAHKDVRLSLAGAQDKAAVTIRSDGMWLPLQGSPSTHIVKPGVAGLDGYVQHEHLCMRLAASLGLPVANTSVRVAEGVSYLLVERYDRVLTGERVRRLHQEDLCQALSVPSSRKYENEGGPSLERIFGVMDRSVAPAPDRIALRDFVLANVLLGNVDAHAKNISILHEPEDHRLAPFYDLSCGMAYDLDDRLAMRLGGTYDVDQLAARHWERFARSVGLAYPPLRARLLQMAADLPAIAAAEVRVMKDAGHDHEILERVVTLLAKRGPRVARTIRD
jgi:serine/threonine-protein kinase HipA